ncbi:MAG: DUF2169 domain-containing protein [Candidatus Methylophosphatis roskildensis]
MSIESVIYGDLPGAVFEFRFYHGNPYHCCALKATFAFDAGGELELLEEQPPLVFGDHYDIDIAGGNPQDPVTTGDLLYLSDLTPYKPVTDLLIIGSVSAPGGRPVERWAGQIVCGKLAKALIFTGPRAWRIGRAHGWRLGKPQPTTSVPLRYSLAYGGRARFDIPYAKHKPEDLDMRNPIGRGFLAAREKQIGIDYPAPQIELPEQPVRDDPHHAVAPAGFGPIPGHFMARLNLAGTYDKRWRDEVAPNVPLDMDLRYWNGAPADQQIGPNLEGNETVSLIQLLPEPRIDLELPNLIGWAQVDREDGTKDVQQMWLDTVCIDLDARHLILRWGWLTPFADDIRRISLHCPRQSEWQRDAQDDSQQDAEPAESPNA